MKKLNIKIIPNPSRILGKAEQIKGKNFRILKLF